MPACVVLIYASIMPWLHASHALHQRKVEESRPVCIEVAECVSGKTLMFNVVLALGDCSA